MKVLSTAGLSLKTELKVKCNNCESELLGTLSEFKARAQSEITRAIESKYQTNLEWWCGDLGLTNILDDIPNIEDIRDDEKNIDKLQNDLLGFLIKTKFKSGLVIFPEEDNKRIRLYTKCPVCGQEVETYIVNYKKLYITSPYVEGKNGEKPYMLKLQKRYGKYTQTIEIKPTNKEAIQYFLDHGFKTIDNEK